jgi:hypothetical protein
MVDAPPLLRKYGVRSTGGKDGRHPRWVWVPIARDVMRAIRWKALPPENCIPDMGSVFRSRGHRSKLFGPKHQRFAIKYLHVKFLASGLDFC